MNICKLYNERICLKIYAVIQLISTIVPINDNNQPLHKAQSTHEHLYLVSEPAVVTAVAIFSSRMREGKFFYALITWI